MQKKKKVFQMGNVSSFNRTVWYKEIIGKGYTIFWDICSSQQLRVYSKLFKKKKKEWESSVTIF